MESNSGSGTADKKKRSAGSAAVFDALNSQVKEREAERLAKIQQQRAAELASLKSRSSVTALAEKKADEESKSTVSATTNKRLHDISCVVEGKSSIVASMKSAMNLEEKSTTTKAAVVFDLNDFYMKQRSESARSNQQKGEAAKYLQRGASGQQYQQQANSLPQGADAYFRSVAETGNDDVVVENMPTFNFSKTDYRAFVFVIHEDFGMMLLHCTRKRKKGPHFQLPGGHVDEVEFIAASRKNIIHPKMHLLYAAKRAAARELLEETGLDFRDQLDRLEPAHLLEQPSKPNILTFEHKHRIFFCIQVTDKDFFQQRTDDPPLPKEYTMPLCCRGCYLFIKLSNEHSGFTFEKDLNQASSLLKQHSGGHVTEALNLYLSFLAYGKQPEAIDAPCEWIEREINIQQQQTALTASSKAVAAKDSDKAKTLPTKSAKSPLSRDVKKMTEMQQIQKGCTTDNNNTRSLSENISGKYQDQFMSNKGLIPSRRIAESIEDNTPRTEVSDERQTHRNGSPCSWCCYCFWNRRVASSSDAANDEGTALLKR